MDSRSGDCPQLMLMSCTVIEMSFCNCESIRIHETVYIYYFTLYSHDVIATILYAISYGSLDCSANGCTNQKTWTRIV